MDYVPHIDNVYIADTYNARIRKVTAGIISTIAGKSTNGYSGDNVAATSTTLYSPWGLSVDTSGILHTNSNLLVALSYLFITTHRECVHRGHTKQSRAKGCSFNEYNYHDCWHRFYHHCNW